LSAFLSAEHRRTLAAVAETLLPDGVRLLPPATITGRVDAFLARVDSPAKQDIQTALTTLEHLLPVMVLRFERFSRLGVRDRRRLIEKLIESKGFFRDIARVLKALVMFGYYTDPDVRRAIGYVEVDERPRLSGVDQTPLTFPPPGVP
jgi:hypothetical protein